MEMAHQGEGGKAKVVVVNEEVQQEAYNILASTLAFPSPFRFLVMKVDDPTILNLHQLDTLKAYHLEMVMEPRLNTDPEYSYLVKAHLQMVQTVQILKLAEDVVTEER